MKTDTPETATADECPECCCVERICCDDPVQAEDALTALMVREMDVSHEPMARKYAAWLINHKHLALVPKSIQPFVADVVRMSKQAHP